jgi:hypothetical protein
LIQPAARLTHQVMDYNVPGGKLNRGMAVYDVLAAIKGQDVSMTLAKLRVRALCIRGSSPEAPIAVTPLAGPL